MKKIFTLIAAALCTLGASAEIVTDVSSFKNYIYVDTETVTLDGFQTSLTAGTNECVLLLGLKQDGAAQTLGFYVDFPEGWTPVGGAAIQDIWSYTQNALGKKTYALSEKEYTITNNTFQSGLLGGGADCNYNAESGVVYAVVVNVPANATTPAQITVREGEVSVTEAYKTSHGFEYNYEKHDVVCTVPVAGADAIENVAAHGTEASAVAKKLVDGKIVIETAKATYNVAGATVK